MHMSHWRRPPNWVAVCTNGTSSLTPTFSPLSAVTEYLRRKPSGCTRMLIEPVFSPPHDHVSLVLCHGFNLPRWRSHARSMLWKLSQVAAPERIRFPCYLTKSYGFRRSIAPPGLPGLAQPATSLQRFVRDRVAGQLLKRIMGSSELLRVDLQLERLLFAVSPYAGLPLLR